MAEPAIACNNLTKYYGRICGIENLELEVSKGEVFGFLGPNGAGKTTTLRLLLDLIRPTRGTARILGRHCQGDGLAVRRMVGYLPGEFNLYERLTGKQLLNYLGALRGGNDTGFVQTLADRLGAQLDRTIGSLSHGNKQKLALLQALAPRPEVLILDEPTSGLDPLVRQVFHQLIAEARAEGRTVFLSSHDLAEVEKTCDRIGSVREGRLIAIESVASLRSAELRIVRLKCAREPDPEPFMRLPGIDGLEITGRNLECRVRGQLGSLLAAAMPFEVLDILSREPTLEEFFLALYGRNETGHAD